MLPGQAPEIRTEIGGGDAVIGRAEQPFLSGRHHGIEGFREFSNPRGVVVRGTGDLTDAFLPPYGPTGPLPRLNRASRLTAGALQARFQPLLECR